MKTQNIITLEDYLKTSDHSQSDLETIRQGSPEELGGLINVFDATTGRQLLANRRNKVLLRGRTFALENLFKDTVPTSTSGYPYTSLDRKINSFRVGVGGTPTNDIMSPTNVVPTDEGLTAQVPFQEGVASPTPELLALYCDVYQDPNTELYTFNGKKFDEVDPPFIFDKSSNKVCKKLSLRINAQDVRDQPISELALYFSADDYSQAEIYSKVHFPTEPFSGVKELLFEYWTFA